MFTTALLVLAASSCGDTPVDPADDFQVIEETTFAPSLAVDLGSMTQLPSGVYVEDLVVGTGAPAIYGASISIHRRVWLSDGTLVYDSPLNFVMGSSSVILGLEDAIFNLPAGSTRRAIIPPRRAYGGIPQVNGNGTVIIPSGAILVYEMALDSVRGG